MRFAFEKETRRASDKNNTIIIKEYQDKRNGNIYCRIHKNFEESEIIKDKTFEELCKIYNTAV